MSRHPSSALVEVVGIDNGSRGRSCEDHADESLYPPPPVAAAWQCQEFATSQ
jgi:hypothetical protein